MTSSKKYIDPYTQTEMKRQFYNFHRKAVSGVTRGRASGVKFIIDKGELYIIPFYPMPDLPTRYFKFFSEEYVSLGRISDNSLATVRTVLSLHKVIK